MANPMIRIHDVTTNEIVDRKMTDDEFAEYTANQLAITNAAEVEAAKEAARAAILEKLGITADEAAALFS